MNDIVRKHPDALCEECPLHRDGEFVPSAGPTTADIVVVGEAPGANESKVGKPFIGESGQLLNAILKHKQIERDNLRVTNACLCRDSSGATPSAKALTACRPRLMKEIQQSGATKVLALGNSAAQSILDSKLGITRLRLGFGHTNEEELPGVTVYCSYHPAACLRVESFFPTLVSDVGKMSRDANSTLWYEPKWKAYDDPEEALVVLELLQNRPYDRPPVIDIESDIEKDVSFEQPTRHKMLCIGIGYERGKVVVLGEFALEDQRVREAFGNYLRSRKIRGQNIKFDVKGMWAYSGYMAEADRDSMLLSYVQDERPGIHSLEYQGVELLGAPDWKHALDKYKVPGRGYGAIVETPEGRQALYYYNALDIHVTDLLIDLHEREIAKLPVAEPIKRLADGKKRSLLDVQTFLLTAGYHLAFTEVNGIGVDLKYNAQLWKEYQEVLQTLRKEIAAAIPSEEWASFNPNSPIQVKKVIKEEFGMRLPMKLNTKKEFSEAQPLTAKILTPTGWISMGDVQVGDLVIGSNGMPTEVVGISPQTTEDVYRITFSDGGSTECTDNHLWTVTHITNNNTKTVPLSWLRQHELRMANGVWSRYIPYVDAINFEPKNLHVDPYLMGLLLGDGSFSNYGTIKLTSADEEILDYVRKEIAQHTLELKHISRYDYRIASPDGNRFANYYNTAIRSYGLEGKRSWEKSVPREYLEGSVEQRLALLQGLMDTDGTVSEARHTSFAVTSKQLALDVQYLVRSLGGWARLDERPSDKGYRTIYNVSISMPLGTIPFRLARKDKRCFGRYYVRHRSLQQIDYTGKKVVQCIKVAAVDGLYVTDDFVITHNTTDKDALEGLAEKALGTDAEAFFRKMLEHRKEAKQFGTYVKGIRKRTYRGRTNSVFLLHGTTTGRLSSRNPNLQNIIRSAKIKRQFVPINKDHVFVQGDFGQAELRVLCWLAQDEYLRAVFNDPSRDLFDEFTPRLYGDVTGLDKPALKELRIRVKAYVYGISYGREARSIALEFGISVAEAERGMKALFNVIPQVVSFREMVRQMVLNGEDLVTPFGRHRRFYLITKNNRKDILNEALAFLPQSTASDTTVDAVCHLRPRLKGIGWIRNIVHDSILAECHVDNVGRVKALLVEEMLAAAQRVVGGYVAFKVDTEVGSSWGDLISD